MLNMIKTAALSGAVVLTALAAVPAARADSLYIDGGHVGIGVGDDGYRDRDRDDEYRHRDRDDDGFRDHDRDRRGGPRCSPDRALDKAERMGVRAARIRFVGPRLIGVVGRSHGRRVEVTFGRAPFCPVVG